MTSYTAKLNPSGDLSITIPKEVLDQVGADADTEIRFKLTPEKTLVVEFLTEEMKLELPDDVLTELNEIAHECGITLNECVLQLLEDEVKGHLLPNSISQYVRD
jgi:antitoxin component of MazEF toxin-antitoxin module